MGRSSLSGIPPRTRTVDDDLADNHLTRADLADGEYAFKRVWARLRSQGWYARPGPPLSYDHYYIKPGCTVKDGDEGVDYFYGEAALVAYGLRILLFEGESASASDAPPVSTSMSPSSSNGRGASASPAVKTETTGVKHEQRSNGKGKVKPVERRQWPASHKHKGRHAADAICIDSDDDDEEEEDERPFAPKRPVAGKRRIEDDDDDDEDVDNSFDAGDDASVGTLESDATGHSEASTASASGKRPLLTTRATKKQKLTTKSRYRSGNTVMTARKRKSAPRGLMFDGRSYRQVLEEQTTPVAPHGTKAARHKPPASPKAAAERSAHHAPVHPPTEPKPAAAHGLESEFNATVKEEPVAFAPPTPARQSSRASSVASSQHSSSAPRNSVTETLLDVEGVVFPACPNERYRVLITQVSGTSETTIWIEESTTLEQRHFTFTDITELSNTPNNLIPDHAICQALYRSLVALGENVTVHPPPPKTKSDSSDNDASSINLIRDASSERIELRYPDTTQWFLSHFFPLTPVPESRQVHALREELARTKQELRSTQGRLSSTEGRLDVALRDLEAFRKQHEQLEGELRGTRGRLDAAEGELCTTRGKLDVALRDNVAFRKQHEQLEGEYQKVRKALEQATKQRVQQKTQAQPLPRAPSPSPPRAPAHAQPKAQAKAQQPPQAKAQPSPQPKAQASAKTKAQPSPQAKAQPPAKAPQTKAKPQSHAKAQPKVQAQPKPPAPSPAKAQKPPEQPPRQQEKKQEHQKSPVGSSSTAQQAPAAAPRFSILASATTGEPRTFHATGDWLATMFLKCPAGTPWVVVWKKSFSANSEYYTVITDDEKPKEVKINVTGTYKLTMSVNHASSYLLSVVVTTVSSGVRRVSFHPHLIQVTPSATGPRYKSYFDRTIHCSANDTVYAELRPCVESDPLSGKVEHLEKFKSSSNEWKIEWMEDHGHTNGAMNGKQQNGTTH